MAESKVMKRIKRMARLAGINPSSKTINNVRTFLDVYKNINRETGHFKTLAKPIPAKEACPILFQELLGPKEIMEDIIEELECRFMADGWFQKAARDTLDDVKGFGEEGKLYYRLLDDFYFSDVVTDEDEYMESIGLCRSGYYDKKREAILLYGVYFWGRLLDLWPSAAEEMRLIEEKCGRGDELTRGLRMGRNSVMNSMIEEEFAEDVG